jgi:ABC-type uncharacterized transport system involved in gliding motility auxiliary subunit
MGRLSTPFKLVLLALVFCALVGVSQFLFSRTRLDLTQDRLYTLSDGTKTILKNLKEPITLRFTYSARAAAGYPEIQLYAQQINDLLDAFARNSNDKIKIERISPEPFSDKEDIAMTGGLRGAPTRSGDTLYFGLEATNSSSTASGRKIIPFFTPDREPQLEYDIINIVSHLNTPAKPKVALLTSLPMAYGPGGPMGMVQGTSRPYVIFQQMRSQYELMALPGNFTGIPADVRALVIVHPGALDPVQLYTIDQFVLRGGRVMLFVDPLSEMAQTLQGNEAMLASASPPPLASNMAPLLTAWGVRLSNNKIAGDGKFAQQVSVREGQPIIYLPWIGIRSTSFAQDDLSIQGLHQINLATSGVLELMPRDGISQDALFTTSDLAGLFDTAELTANPDPESLIRSFKPTGAEYVLAARLSGKFTSMYKAPPIEGLPFVAKATAPSSIVIVADSDMLSDPLWVNITGDADTPVVQPVADNGAFFFNALDQMLGAPELMTLRGRRTASRPFTLVQEKQIEAERNLHEQQARFQDDLEKTQARIAALEGAGGTGAQFQSKAQIAEIDGFRKKIVATRKSLREIQGKLRQSVDALQTKIMVANIAAIPLLLLIISLVRTVRRNRRAFA